MCMSAAFPIYAACIARTSQVTLITHENTKVTPRQVAGRTSDACNGAITACDLNKRRELLEG